MQYSAQQRRNVGRLAARRTTKAAAEHFLLELIAILAVLARGRPEEQHRRYLKEEKDEGKN